MSDMVVGFGAVLISITLATLFIGWRQGHLRRWFNDIIGGIRTVLCIPDRRSEQRRQAERAERHAYLAAVAALTEDDRAFLTERGWKP